MALPASNGHGTRPATSPSMRARPRAISSSPRAHGCTASGERARCVPSSATSCGHDGSVGSSARTTRSAGYLAGGSFMCSRGSCSRVRTSSLHDVRDGRGWSSPHGRPPRRQRSENQLGIGGSIEAGRSPERTRCSGLTARAAARETAAGLSDWSKQGSDALTVVSRESSSGACRCSRKGKAPAVLTTPRGQIRTKSGGSDAEHRTYASSGVQAATGRGWWRWSPLPVVGLTLPGMGRPAPCKPLPSAVRLWGRPSRPSGKPIPPLQAPACQRAIWHGSGRQTRKTPPRRVAQPPPEGGFLGLSAVNKQVTRGTGPTEGKTASAGCVGPSPKPSGARKRRPSWAAIAPEPGS